MDNVETLKGVQFLVDSLGNRTAVVLDIAEWGELWEDFYDVLVAESRKDEETVAWNSLRDEHLSLSTVQSKTESEPNGLYTLAGIWEERDVTLTTIRKRAWLKPD